LKGFKDMETPDFVPSMRLNIQASVPVESQLEATAIYQEIKCFLKTYHTDITLNGQVMMMLEPCCKDKEKKP
jgi:hypothetical protein